MPLQIRRGTNAERQLLASPLVSGELLWITDDQRLYIGDGTTLAKDLLPVTGYNSEDAQDDAASLFTSGSHSGISFVYDDANDKIDATVSYSALLQNLNMNSFDITGTGNITISGAITADSFVGDYKGSIAADDSTILVDSVNGSINLNGTVKGDIIPDQDEVYDLGSNTKRFKDLYLSGTSLFLGSAQITATGAAVNLPPGSTINGVLISNVESGVAAGSDYNINIVGDDSSSIINSSTRTVTASGGFFGNLVGDVNGDTFGVHRGDIVDDTDTIRFDSSTGGFIGNLSGTVNGNVIGNVDGNLTGNSTGYHFGDMSGSVFSNSSALMIDANDVSFHTSSMIIQGNSIEAFGDEAIDLLDTSIVITAETDFGSAIFPRISFDSYKTSAGNRVALADNDLISVINARPFNGVDFSTGGVLAFIVDDSSISPGDAHIGTKVLIGDASHVIVQDGAHITVDADGVTSSAAFVTGSYATGAEPSNPVAGMIIFDSTTQKYKGYVSDTGLAGGGPSNGSPGWVDFY